jgi:hypothetical protein
MLLEKIFSIVALCLCMAACSPKFDWRETRMDELGVRSMLPGKPSSMERQINLAGLPLKMMMVGAKVDELTFTVAAARLPESTPAQATHLEAMQQQMLRNIGASSAAATPVQISLVDAAGKAVGQVAGAQIKTKGKVGNKEVTMQAIFCKSGERLIQAVVLGSDWNDSASQQFFDSFKIEQRP